MEVSAAQTAGKRMTSLASVPLSSHSPAMSARYDVEKGQ